MKALEQMLMHSGATVTVELSIEAQAACHSAIEAGEYRDTQDILAEAMEEWRVRRFQRDAVLRALCDEGRASGNLGELDLDAFFAEVQAEVRQERESRRPEQSSSAAA